MKPRVSKPTIVNLTEWQGVFCADLVLADTDRQLAETLGNVEGGRLWIDELRTGIRITASSWVGVVRFENFEIRIAPKLAGGNLGLIEMLEFTSGLDTLRRFKSIRNLNLLKDNDSLLDLIALLFVEACKIVVRAGILADYVEREDEVPYVRGRFLGERQMFKRFGQIDRVICRFDELEQDILENQLILAALQICGKRVTHELVKPHVRKQQAIFEEICTADRFDLETARYQVIYHRLNEHYRDAHSLAWLIIDCFGVKDLLASGDTPCFAFLMDMNRLFERFTFHLLNRLLDHTYYHVRYQKEDRSIIWNAVTQQPYAKVVPDFLVESQRNFSSRLAIDAKYKLYDERKIAMGDIYQSFLYAYAYGSNPNTVLPHAVLLYPASDPSSRPTYLHIRSAERLVAAEVLAFGISLPEVLSEIRHGLHGPYTNAILKVIEKEIGNK